MLQGPEMRISNRVPMALRADSLAHALTAVNYRVTESRPPVLAARQHGCLLVEYMLGKKHEGPLRRGPGSQHRLALRVNLSPWGFPTTWRSTPPSPTHTPVSLL